MLVKGFMTTSAYVLFPGFFSGCTVALVVAVVLRIQARNLMERPEGASYMVNIFPLYRQEAKLNLLGTSVTNI